MKNSYKKQLLENLYNEYNSMVLIIALKSKNLDLGTYEKQGNKDFETIIFNNRTVSDLIFTDDSISCVMSFNKKKCNVNIPYDCVSVASNDYLGSPNSEVFINFKISFEKEKPVLKVVK